MSKYNKKLYIGIFVILLLFVFFLIPSFKKENQIIETQKNAQENNQSVTILAGKITTHLLLPSKTLLYDALTQAKNTNNISFSGRNYPGLGFFVTDIGTLHAGNGKNLLYYINGKEATVGVSSYTLKDGDVIEWKLE